MAGFVYFGKNIETFENELRADYDNNWICEELYLTSSVVSTDKATELDALNLKKERNENNTSTSKYNCMGYALDFYGWGLPVSMDYETPQDILEELGIEPNEELEDDLSEAIYVLDYGCPLMMDLAVKRMLEAFDGKLRRIYDINEAREDEIVVIYRGGEGDFHFAKIEDGIISHKRGSSLITTEGNLSDCFQERYYSDNVLFARSF